MRIWNRKEVVTVFGKSVLIFQVPNAVDGSVCYTWESRSWSLHQVHVYQNTIQYSGPLQTKN